MNEIPDVSKEYSRQRIQGVNKNHSSTPSQQAQGSKAPTNQDKTRVAPMNKWIEMLKEMPDEVVENAMESYHEERLQDVVEKFNSGYFDENFEETIFPRLFNELGKDWNIPSKGS